MNRKDQDTGSTTLDLSLEMRETPRRRNNAETQTWKKQPGSIGDRTRLHGNEFWLRSRRRQAGNDLGHSSGSRTRKTNQALVDLLGKFAEQKKATPAQLALVWLLAKKPWIVPIPGTTKLHRLEENLGAAAVELTPNDVRALEDASSKIKLEGARYPAFHAKLVGR